MFLICTYLDGDRWESGLEPLLYPTGMSFYRPFSYRSNYFHPEQLADQLTNPEQSKSLLSTNWNEGFFGVRFKNQADADFIPLFVPLRKVKLASVDASGRINIAFRLGEYVKPIRRAANGPSFFPTFDLTGIVSNPTDTKLFINPRDSDKTAIQAWGLDDCFPPETWDALQRTVSPAANATILNTLLLRLLRVRQRGKSDPLGSEELDAKNHIWGIRLQENTAYDVLLEYVRIMKPKSQAPPIEHQFLLTNPQDELRASRRLIQINANYRNEEIWINPKSAGPGPVQIAFEPCTLAEGKLVDPKQTKTIGLKFPAIVIPLRWPKTRIINLLILAGSIVLTAVFIRKYLGATQEVMLLGIAGLISLAANALKDVLLPKT